MIAALLAETTFWDGAAMAAAIFAAPVALWLVTRPPQVDGEITFGGAFPWPAAVGVLIYLVAHPWGFAHLQFDDPHAFYLSFAALKAVLGAAGLAVAWRACRRDPIGLSVPSGRAVGWGAAVYALILPAVLLLASKTDDGTRQSTVSDLIAADMGTKAALALYLVVVVPLFEELVFRGLIQGGLRRRASAVEAIVISSVLFTLVHPAPFWPSIAILGLLFGWIYEKSRTVWASTLVHALHNALTFALIVTDPGDFQRA